MAPPQPPLATSQPWSPRAVARITLALLALGILWRIVKFALAMPVWGDEAMLAVNLLDRSFPDLVKPLQYAQVAPLGFLAGEWAALRTFGLGEFAIRLFPFVCGLAALFLFYRLARQLLSPVGAMIALGTFAVGTYTARHAVELKPYAGDQLAAVALLLPAALYLKTGRARWLWILAAVAAPAISISFPACFIVAGIGLTLLFPALKSRRPSALAATALFGLLAVAAFAAIYLVSIRGQYDATGDSMREYWSDSFPPSNILHLAWWLLDVHAGNMLAHPFGGKHFASAGTLLVCLAGGWTLWTIRHADPQNHLAPAVSARWLLPLLLLPFVFTLIAAAARRYPYGGSARIAMHLAPAICLLAGLGWQAILSALKKISWRRAATVTLAAALAAIALGGILFDCIRPYKTLPDAQVRQVVQRATTQAPKILVASRTPPPVNFLWYLRASGRPFDQSSPDLAAPTQKTVILCFSPDDQHQLDQRLTSLHLRCLSRSEGKYQIGPIQYGPAYCAVTVWEPAPAAPLFDN
jgi:hypothetical protein